MSSHIREGRCNGTKKGSRRRSGRRSVIIAGWHSATFLKHTYIEIIFWTIIYELFRTDRSSRRKEGWCSSWSPPVSKTKFNVNLGKKKSARRGTNIRMRSWWAICHIIRYEYCSWRGGTTRHVASFCCFDKNKTEKVNTRTFIRFELIGQDWFKIPTLTLSRPINDTLIFFSSGCRFHQTNIAMDPLVPFVKAVIIMDGEGNRLSSKVFLIVCFVVSRPLSPYYFEQYYSKDEFPTDVDRVSPQIE